MKRLILSILCFINSSLIYAQTNPVSDIVEGGKALVELIKIFKTPKKNLGIPFPKNQHQTDYNDENCETLQQSDLCFKNSSSQSVIISIYRRNGKSYETSPFTMKVISQKEECWFDLKAGIYKYKIEVDAGILNTLLREGEFKLEACENMQREIKD